MTYGYRLKLIMLIFHYNVVCYRLYKKYCITCTFVSLTVAFNVSMAMCQNWSKNF